MDTFMCQYNINFLTPADALLAIIKSECRKKAIVYEPYTED